MKGDERWHRWVADFQSGQISDSDFADLEESLRNSADARERFHRACRIDSRLRRESENAEAEHPGDERKVVPMTKEQSLQRRPFLGGIGVAAALLLLSAITWTIAAQHRIVATLVSSENAAWESSVATGVGSDLSRGVMRLSSGIATLRFDSGVDLTLEAPAKIFLKGPKKAKLVSGTAVVTSGEDGEFYLETEFGQAVIGSGECVIQADTKGGRFGFRTISGEVQLSHDVSREAILLSSGSSAFLLPDKLESGEPLENEKPFERFDRGLRIRTDGRAATFIRNNNPYKWTRPEFLTLKNSNQQHGFDQRSVIGFDLSMVNAEHVGSATLQFNLVPSGTGLASRLPRMNRFAVYGLDNPAKQDWSGTETFENAPAAEDGILVGHFEIPRSQQTGVIRIEGNALSNFVKARASSSATFILVRETANSEGVGHGLVHAIASDVHPEASGPVLEIVLNK